MQIQSSCTESIADKLKVLYEHTVFEKGDPFFLWPQNSPGKMDTHARYLHYHNELELGWCTEGSGIFFVEDKVIPFQAPCASVIYQGQIHIAQSNPDKPAKWYFINVDECILSAKDDESLTAGHIGAPILDDSTAEGRDILTLVQMVVDELQAKRPGSRQCAEWLVRSILYKHARLSDHRQVAPWLLAEVSPAVTYVSNHYAEPCPIETLAQLCNMSVSTLRRKFYSALECAPSDYIHRVRIGAATVMLSAENKSILEICHQVGYMSLSSFNRQFRKLTGESPREMRNRMRKKQTSPLPE